MNVVLNTDNRLMSGTTLTDEYRARRAHLGFTFDELCEIALNGFASAFLPWEERERCSPVRARDIALLARQRRGMTTERSQYGAVQARQPPTRIRDRGWRRRRRAAAAIILGSGLGGLADEIDPLARIPFAEIPGFPTATVVGHAGALIAGTLGGKVRPRAGRPLSHVRRPRRPRSRRFPPRVMHALGAPTLIVSNAAGGVNRLWQPGDLMLIRDHINLMFRNPLIGAVEPGDLRFPDMSGRTIRAGRSGARRRARAGHCSAKGSTPG